MEDQRRSNTRYICVHIIYVYKGKGEFICGNIDCTKNEGLSSWELDFNYERKK